MYETGAGGSAPKHVQQFVQCGHLRWNSLGEYQAFAEALVTLGRRLYLNSSKNADAEASKKLAMLGECLYKAIGVIMEKHEMPERRVGEVDNRDTNAHIALHWAEFLAEKDSAAYKDLYLRLKDNEQQILEEIKKSQGTATDLGGYYLLDYGKAYDAMNPSKTLKEILDSIVVGK